MDEGDDFDYNGLDGVVFDEEVAGSPGQGLEERQTGEVVEAAATAACAYDSNYESDDLATRSPAKKPKTDTGRSGGGRKKGLTSTRQVHTPPLTCQSLTLRLPLSPPPQPAPPIVHVPQSAGRA
jgi:hypothetical protein